MIKKRKKKKTGLFFFKSEVYESMKEKIEITYNPTVYK